jgi:oligosaccharide repeat unit polymerase
VTGDLLFIVSTLGSIILFFLFLKKFLLGYTLKLTRLTLLSFFIIAYIILMSFPSIVWFYGSTHQIRYTYFLAVQSVPILLLLGGSLANVFFRHPARIITGFLSPGLTKARRDLYLFSFYICMLLSSILIIAVLILTADYVPLLGSFTGYGEMSGELVRQSIYRSPDSIQYAHALTLRIFLPFCLLCSYFMAYVYKRAWRYIFWITALLMLFSSLLTFERAYPLSLFILLALGVYFKNNQIMPRSHFSAISNIHIISKSKIRFAIVILAIFALAVIVGGVISRAQYNLPLDLRSLWNTLILFLISRIWLDPSHMACIHFEEFNNPTTFLYGKSIRLLSLFGAEFRHTVSPSFVADLWINFGWFGIIIGTIIIGFILQFIQLWLFKKKSISTLIIYIILLLNAVWLIYGHVLSTMVVSVYLLSVLFLLVLLPIVEGAVGIRRSSVLIVSLPNTSKADQ